MGGGAIDLDAVIETVPRVGEVGIRADVVVQQFDIDGWNAIAVVGDKNTDFRRQSCRTSRNMRARDRDIAGAGDDHLLSASGAPHMESAQQDIVIVGLNSNRCRGVQTTREKVIKIEKTVADRTTHRYVSGQV